MGLSLLLLMLSRSKSENLIMSLCVEHGGLIDFGSQRDSSITKNKGNKKSLNAFPSPFISTQFIHVVIYSVVIYFSLFIPALFIPRYLAGHPSK